MADVTVDSNDMLPQRWSRFRVIFHLEPSDWACVVVDRVFWDNFIQELISHVAIFIDPKPPCIPPKTLVG